MTPVQPAEDPELFVKIKEGLKDRHVERDLLVSIPIWGWTGDGKTVSLLTATRLLNVFQHGVALAVVDDTTHLRRMESESDVYRGLNLVATAQATRSRFRELSEEFFDKCKWPHGTDEATPYLFEIRTIKGTVGYALFPDLRGGDYEEFLSPARDVLDTKHASAILVKPDHFIEDTVKGKRYQDAVVGVIQASLGRRLPTAALITQCDKYPGSGSVADKAHELLTVLLDQFDDLPRFLSRVSVIGSDTSAEGTQPPPMAKRKPDALLKTFSWLLFHAITRPKSELHNLVPSLTFQLGDGDAWEKPASSLPEVRSVGEYSGVNGVLVAASTHDPRVASFVFLSTDGDLVEANLPLSGGGEPRLSSCGRLEEAPKGQVQDYVAALAAGTLTIGPRKSADNLWHGTKGADLRRTELPSTLISWVRAAQNLVIGIDASGSGRLTALRLEGNRWLQQDFVGNFIEPTPFISVWWLERTSTVLVLNGRRAEAIRWTPGGQFGERTNFGGHPVFDTDAVRCGRSGLVVAARKADKLLAVDGEKAIPIVEPLTPTINSFAVGDGRMIASQAKDQRLIVSRIENGTVRQTSPEYSPVLPASSMSMMWSDTGGLIAVTFEGGKWAVFKPFGLGNRNA